MIGKPVSRKIECPVVCPVKSWCVQQEDSSAMARVQSISSDGRVKGN